MVETKVGISTAVAATSTPAETAQLLRRKEERITPSTLHHSIANSEARCDPSNPHSDGMESWNDEVKKATELKELAEEEANRLQLAMQAEP